MSGLGASRTAVGRRAANRWPSWYGPSRLGLLAAALLVLLAGGILFSAPMTLQVNAQTDLTAPSALTAQREGCGVSLSWEAPQEDASSVTGYRVLQAKGSAALETLVSDTGSTDTEYSDGSVEKGESYSYRVQALRGATASAQSALAEIAIPTPPTPTAVAVTAVPIVVTSTTDDYFVLYARHTGDYTNIEIPVAVVRGEAGTTTLSERIGALPKERYRVEKYAIANPADVDGDCIDDLSDTNPVSSAQMSDPSHGATNIPDHATFEALAYEYPYGRLPSYMKFITHGANTNQPRVYFANTKRYLETYHYDIANALGVPESNRVNGILTYEPELVAPDGSQGVYWFQLSPMFDHLLHQFDRIDALYTALAASMPLLNDNLALLLRNAVLFDLQSELPKYRESRMEIVFDEDILPESAFISMNQAEGYGTLRQMEPGDRPHPRDIVVYETLPNNLPRVAGIITTVPQTPLSHVNLRAIQHDLPNAYIRDALEEDSDVTTLLGSYVHYVVTKWGWEIRAATVEEVNTHYAASRPAATQTPKRDLTIEEITALDDIGFDDSDAFGVKAANLAELRRVGFPSGAVPNGFAIPFYFYDQFMKEATLGEETLFGKKKWDDDDNLTLPTGTTLKAVVAAILAHSGFQTDLNIQDEMLGDLRDAIKEAETPDWIIDALTEMHDTYPEGQSLRYRSSTNNEDLPGFNGAGLYDSKTQNPAETEEDGIDKSLKQVFASLWNLRAFTEREFYRIDHEAAAMGVLVHPNFSDEQVNGVAVSFDPVYGTDGSYYINSQVGEDLVTNPEANSIPEELMSMSFGNMVLARSNLVEPGELLMTEGQVKQLRSRLSKIHSHFKKLYQPASGEKFAMEIEFKITSDDVLAIKQARPWVFAGNPSSKVSVTPTPTSTPEPENSPATGQPAISGTVQAGETLTADASAIADGDGLDNAVFRYQWLADDAAIANATGSTYTLADGDVGQAIKVRVSFTDDRGNAETLTSAATAQVVAAPKPEPTPEPLTAAWSPPASHDGAAFTFPLSFNKPVNLSYRNLRDVIIEADGGSVTKSRRAVQGSNQSWNVTVVPDGTGDITLRLNVRGACGDDTAICSNEGELLTTGLTDTVSSPVAATPTPTPTPTPAPTPEPVNHPATGQPAISGTAEAGETLSADASAIADGDGLDNAVFHYQWLADGAAISGASGSTYTLTYADVGQVITVQVDFTDDQGNAESLTSPATAGVTAGPQDASGAHAWGGGELG